MRSLHRKHNQTFDIVCKSNLENFYKRLNFINKIFVVDVDKDLQVKYFKELKASYDILINPTFSRCYLSEFISKNINAKKKITLKGDNANQHEEKVRLNLQNYDEIIENINPQLPEFLKLHLLFKHLFPEIFPKPLKPLLKLKSSERSWAYKFYKENKLRPNKTICFFPGTGTSIRKYNKFGEALETFQNYYDCDILILGHQSDFDLGRRNISKLRNVVNHCGKTSLSQCIALLSHARCAFGSETGIAHLASALSIHHTILLGGGHAGRFMPYSKYTSAVVNPLECFNCNWYCTQSEVRCINDIKPILLFTALKISWDKLTYDGSSLVYSDHNNTNNELILKIFTFYEIIFDKSASITKAILKIKK